MKNKFIVKERFYLLIYSLGEKYKKGCTPKTCWYILLSGTTGWGFNKNDHGDNGKSTVVLVGEEVGFYDKRTKQKTVKKTLDW